MPRVTTPRHVARSDLHLGRRYLLGRPLARLLLLQNSLTTVFGLGVLILLFGPVSGAHFNPVVSAVDWAVGRRSRTGLPGRDLLADIVAQIVGGIGGALLANIMRQGKGSFVRQRTERSVGLRPHLEQASEQTRVTIDFAGFSGEQVAVDPARCTSLSTDGSLHSGHTAVLVPEMALTAVDLLLRSPSQPDMIRRWRRS